MQRNPMCECFSLNRSFELSLRFKGVICVPLVSPCYQTGFLNTRPIRQIALSQTHIIAWSG